MTSNSTAQAKPTSRLTLLIQWEPAHRVFFRNLADTLLFRSPQPLETTTAPAPFWKDVFVPTGIGWGGFLESMLWHTLAILAVWTLSQQPSLQPIQRHPESLQASYLSYYRSPLTFPARGSSPRGPVQHSGRRSGSMSPSAMVVAPERANASSARRDVINAPQVRLAAQGRSGLVAANSPLPMMPFAAASRSQLTLPPADGLVVAPAPAVNQGTSRWGGLTQSSVIRPPPSVSGGSVRSGIAPAALAVVAPSPTVTVQRGSLRVGDINIGHSQLIAPAPELPMEERTAIPGLARGTLGGVSVVAPTPSGAGLATFGNGRGAVLARAGVAVVAPAPTLQGIGTSAGNGGGTKSSGSSGAHGNGLAGSGLHVVPPPPTVQGMGGLPGGGTANSFSGTGLSVVQPAPATQGLGGAAASGRGRGSGTGLSGTGLPVVPPPPAVQALAGSSGGGRGNALSGTGFSVASPAPSAQGISSTGSGGRGNGLGPGFSVGAPDPSAQHGGGSFAGTLGNNAGHNGAGAADSAASISGTGDSASGERLMAKNVPPAVAPLPPLPPLVAENPPAPGKELPLRVISLILPLPKSSYFSNYEVFLAERWLGKGEFEIIKLVYEFLPYQQRLSEYHLDDSMVYKVRVTRDPSCDESLMQMTWPEGESPAQPQPANEIAASTHSRRNEMLSCYRTTADDYRKAVSRPAPAKIRGESKPGS